MNKLESYKNKDRKLSRRTRIRCFVILAVVSTLLLLLSYYFLARHMINENFISKYEDEKYDNLDENSLYTMNFNEPYLVYYNSGNVEYRNGEYAQAEQDYTDALNRQPPHDGADSPECNIRVNLALSMLQQIDLKNLKTQEDISDAIDSLNACRSILTEEGCADEDKDGHDGHDPEAETLKEEIDKLIEQLEQQQQSGAGSSDSDSDSDSDGDNEGNSGNSGDEESDREQEIEDELNQERSDAYDSQRSNNNSGSSSGNNPGGSNYNGDYGDPKW